MAEINPLDVRKEIVQAVIERHLKYGNSYIEALNKFNEKFVVPEIQYPSTQGK